MSEINTTGVYRTLADVEDCNSNENNVVCIYCRSVQATSRCCVMAGVVEPDFVNTSLYFLKFPPLRLGPLAALS